MIAKYRSLLVVPGFTRVLGTALLGRLPQGMSSLAVLLLVRGATHSYSAAGVAVGAYAFAGAALAPVQGRLVDRHGRARVLASCALAQAAALVALVLSARAGAAAALLVALAALSGGLIPAIAPSVRALLRELLSDPEVRETAYALESVVQELIWITGPLLVALAIALVSPSGALLLSAAIGIAGTLLFISSPLARGAGRRGERHRRPAVLAVPELRRLLPAMALMGASLGAIEVGLPSLALYAGSRPSSGLLLALWSVGSLAGGLWYGSRSWRVPLHRRYRGLMASAVVATAPLIAARTIPEAALAGLLAGVTIAPAFSCAYALLGRAVTPGIETEAFTWATAALIVGVAAGSALAGASIDAAGVSGPFVLACGASALAAAMAMRGAGQRRPQAA